jgi:hypothetical protein
VYVLLSLSSRGGLKFFSQFSRVPHPSESMLWTCLCGVSKFNVFSLILLYLAGPGLSFLFMVFLCWPNLGKCSTSDLLKFQKLSYSSSRVLGRSLTRWLWSWFARSAFMACVMACSSETSGACALRRRKLQKKSGSVSFSYCWHEKNLLLC